MAAARRAIRRPTSVLFAAFAALALVSFFRKSVRLKYVTLVAAVAYLGVYKSQLISIVNVFGVMGGNLPIFKYSLCWYLFARLHRRVDGVVGTAVLRPDLRLRRADATAGPDRACETALRHAAADRAAREQDQIRAARRGRGVLPRHARHVDLSLRRAVLDVHAARHDGLWIALGVLLVATVFVRNLYCRFLCPVGAALGLLSKVTVFGIKRWSECKSCKICEKTCEWGAIDGPRS